MDGILTEGARCSIGSDSIPAVRVRYYTGLRLIKPARGGDSELLDAYPFIQREPPFNRCLQLPHRRGDLVRFFARL